MQVLANIANGIRKLGTIWICDGVQSAGRVWYDADVLGIDWDHDVMAETCALGMVWSTS